MITIYKKHEDSLEVLDEMVMGCWIHVVDPTPADVETIVGLGVPTDFITYSLDMDERARTEREDNGTIFILLRVPYYQGENMDLPYITVPLGIILTDQYVITISRWQTEVLEEMASGKIRGVSPGKHNRFLLRILLNTANKFLANLREINRTVDGLEDALQKSMRNREVQELLKYQKSLVYFTVALKSNELVLERLQRSRLFHLYPEDEDLLDDVIIENQQAIEMNNIASNILSSMMDAFASIISNNLNVVMKFLASITIIMSIPTIITGFFGMNVDLPFTSSPLAYLLILTLVLFFSTLVVYIFMKRDWF